MRSDDHSSVLRRVLSGHKKTRLNLPDLAGFIALLQVFRLLGLALPKIPKNRIKSSGFILNSKSAIILNVKIVLKCKLQLTKSAIRKNFGKMLDLLLQMFLAVDNFRTSKQRSDGNLTESELQGIRTDSIAFYKLSQIQSKNLNLV